MKEIEFRAWDKRDGIMRTLFLLNSKGVPLEVGFVEPQVREPEDLILMQYTGLHDKNGKEIYEGDILRFTNRQAVKSPFEVVWDEYYLEWNVKNERHGVADLYSGAEFRDGNTLTNARVIGNIYQNPELMETKEQDAE